MPKLLPSTKHFQLAQQLRKLVQSMKPGEPIPTVMDLRKKFEVSQATVDRALDRLRREGLIVRPAGQLRLEVAEISDPATHRVAMIRPDYPSPTFEELSRVIVEAGKQRDWAFELVSYRKLEGLDLRQALGDNDAGILLPTSEPFPPHLVAALRRPRRPVVIIQDPPVGLSINTVRIDDVQIGKMAVKHLTDLGHRRVLLFLSEPGAPSRELRASGWREQLKEIGQGNLDELVVDPQVKPFDNSIMSSYRYFSAWLDQPHPEFTAIFCAAWTGAVAVLRALREHNLRIPQDVSVISHGGEGYMSSFLFPALTAIETDITHYGQVVVDVLQKQIERPDGQLQNFLIPSTLIQRETTAMCAAQGRV